MQKYLTTKEAEQQYGIPAATFTEWCRDFTYLGLIHGNKYPKRRSKHTHVRLCLLEPVQGMLIKRRFYAAS